MDGISLDEAFSSALAEALDRRALAPVLFSGRIMAFWLISALTSAPPATTL